MNFQDYFDIDQSFLLNIQDLHKQQMMLYQICDIDSILKFYGHIMLQGIITLQKSLF